MVICYAITTATSNAAKTVRICSFSLAATVLVIIIMAGVDIRISADIT
jgi:hypothetical protein